MSNTGQRLESALSAAQDRVRPAELVMAPTTLGAARLTKYSFNRMLLRRAFADRWRAHRRHFDMDPFGQGEAIYEVRGGDCTFTFVAFTTTIDESKHTDRVVANEWEITGALIEGELTPAFLDNLRSQVPLQEDGRFDKRVLVLTRGNRSVRFFQYVVDRLATGQQPDPAHVGDAGYLMRSTAFYGNGKYGMRSFDGYPPGHPLGVPYRAQFLTAWLFRELSLDVAESCARDKGGSSAVSFDHEWKSFFGLGNATGLGLVPYALKHPQVMHAWAAVRELALADVRAMAASPERLDKLSWWIERADAFFASGTSDDCEPFLSPQQLVPFADQIRARFADLRTSDSAFDDLYRWAQQQPVELRELVVALLIELHDGDDAEVDQLLRVLEHRSVDPTQTIAELRTLIADRFGWLAPLDLASPRSDHFWWLMSDNTEEPRRAPRNTLPANGRDLAIDIALRVERLRDALFSLPSDQTVAAFLAEHPQHRMAVERVNVSDGVYGEPRDNACHADFLPLQLQRFQLAMYGMDSFKPKSTDWLRVTLFQGAPRIAALTDPDAFSDEWALPPRPRSCT